MLRAASRAARPLALALVALSTVLVLAWVWVLVLVLSGGRVGAAPPGPGCGGVEVRAAAVDRPRYRATARLDLASRHVTGRFTLAYTPEAVIDRVVLRLWANANTEGPRGRGTPSLAVRVEGGLVTSSPDPTTLEVVLPAPHPAGTPLELAATFDLALPGSRDEAISTVGSSVRLGGFLPVVAWEPGVGWNRTPAAGSLGEGSMSQVADYEVTLELPPGLSALGSGVHDGRGTWRATAVRDVAFTIGRFRVASAVVRVPHEVAVTVGVEAGAARLRDDPDAYLHQVVTALEAHSARFTPYPWTTLTLAVSPGLKGGIEWPSHIMSGPGSLGRSVIHEVAHQWFYGLVGNDQGRDPWLDEGLASWAEARAHNTLGAFVVKPQWPDGRGRLAEPMTYWANHKRAYYRGAYVQAVQALATLGPAEAVDCALREYVTLHANRVATVDDLMAVLVRHFPTVGEKLARYGVPAAKP